MLAVPWLLATGLAIMPYADVHSGQRGVCVTEWSGGEKITIPVEVVGTLPGSQPGQRAVLVRLDDPRFADAGVVAGMSGSPVYVDGKLLGAVAFGWSFAREALAGVTPFEDMKAIPSPQPSPQPMGLEWRTGPGWPGNLAAGGLEKPREENPLQLLAAAFKGERDLASLLPPAPPSSQELPLAWGGGGNSFWTEKFFRPMGFMPVPAASQEASEGEPEAGDMVAAVLVWGDAVLAAGGTLTARDGSTFYAFGHPLIAAGPVRIPAARARVLAVQSSFALPFKIFTVGKAFATFVADQPAGMIAVAGNPPPGLPVTVTVRSGESHDRFRFYMADVPVLKPLLAAFLVATSTSAREGPNADLTVDLTATARFADGRELTIRQNTAGPDAVARAATFTGALVGVLANPPFEAPELTALDLTVARSPHASATILDAIPQRRRVRPGETLPVAVRLQPFRGPSQTKSYTVTIPRGLGPGKVDLIVADGASFADYAVRSERWSPADFPQLLAQLSRLEPSSTLVLALETRETGLSLPAGPMPAVPPSVAVSWSKTLSGNTERLTTNLSVSTRDAFPWPLVGGVRVSVEVLPAEVP
ncbi:MAG: SpoIVB peptidase S55 domain-containing protein [Thermoanaerobaculum sp.]